MNGSPEMMAFRALAHWDPPSWARVGPEMGGSWQASQAGASGEKPEPHGCGPMQVDRGRHGHYPGLPQAWFCVSPSTVISAGPRGSNHPFPVR